MKGFLLPLVVWLIEYITWIRCHQGHGGIGYGIKRDIFFLNLEDGYFGCQVNQSTDVLQLYELSRLCDGISDCYRGTDELARELKCSDTCISDAGIKCENGACLDSQCHCNDGFGGCSCEVPDENECKYRPCDVFAHCTNTLGSFHCSCFPGYTGDGFHCQDVNECEDASIARRCVANAECCNVPAHFVCKCKPGFVGDGEVECRDVDECGKENACGHNAICHNLIGNYTCDCKAGYAGNPFHGCADIDECALHASCGRGALCTNFPGGYHCECPAGSTGDAYKGTCVDINECALNPCGHNAICNNIIGSYQCLCPPGFVGDAYHSCTAIGCASDSECPSKLSCISNQCQNLCQIRNPCDDKSICQIENHKAVCLSGREPSTTGSCNHCPPGVPCDLQTGVCAKVSCLSDASCPINEVCIQGTCQYPCSLHNPCVRNAACVNTNHGIDCSCLEGYQGNAFVECLPVPSYQPVCQYNEDCPPDKLCDRLNRVCINPCFDDSCGENADCVPKNHGIECRCLPGFSGNPYLSCNSVTGCRHDDQCATTEACINGKCSNPCKCGPNALCEVIYHKPSCKCPPGYGGNPNTQCTLPENPCKPNPCGIHALCEIDDGSAVCFCPKGMTGNPFKQCIPEGEDCVPNPCGENSGCRVVQGSAVCFCLPEFEGDPPITACRLPSNPCHPSPCGPNTFCTILPNGFAKCTCLQGYIESPNTVRGCVSKRNPCDPNPCGHRAICDPNRNPSCFCPDPLIGNPYKLCGEPVKSLCQPGPCGHNADCYIAGSVEQCYCKTGYQGDPFVACKKIPTNPCVPNPCGPYSQCTISRTGEATCSCPPGIMQDTTTGICSGLECTVDEDCALNKACIAYRCQDPCAGCCGVGASCRVEKHHPVCTCSSGLTGNPLVRCYLLDLIPAEDPCKKNSCGVNSYCKVVGKRPVCSCIENFVGDPRVGCYPQCVLNTDCNPSQVCSNYQCKDPCSISNVCGLGAVCLCRDHTPTCICREGFTGNPFVQCVPHHDRPTYVNTTLPCVPSPCDPHSQCNVYGDVAMCDPCSLPSSQYNPECHPECLYNTDCPFNLACLGQKCRNPCPGSCGINAHCIVVHHGPVCSCPETLTGDPYQHCSPIPPTTQPTPAPDYCHRNRCGANAICKNNYGHIICECPSGYHGNPYLTCQPECVLNTDCNQKTACINNKCVNPCNGVCGVNAQCQVVNHLPVCFCANDYIGDPFINCYPQRPHEFPPMGKPGNPCDPSPCGSYSRCLISHQGYATCSCLPGYLGSPPYCRPECSVSAECSLTEACINWKCVDPCPGTCGVGAHCSVINHNPICSCPAGHVGDPFIRCLLPPGDEHPKIPDRNPCNPSPCGPNSICQVRDGHPVCSCIANYFGSPPYCRPECVMNQECPFDKACIKEKCVNPCDQSCGLNAKCDVVKHRPYCACLPGYEGDAFVACSKIPPPLPPMVPKDPCYTSPCGENSQCTSHNGVAQCICIPPYIGNPYVGGCHPECVINSDCSPNTACLSSHCRDPCPGVCGINAECTVVNHIPVCSCLSGHVGDPFRSCRPRPAPSPPVNPCDPSPCGPNSVCKVSRTHAICSCNANFIGAPPNCRPECVVSAECLQNLACISQKCSDPCPGTCGLHARCTVINHNPICTCPPNTVGDPFVRCLQREEPREPLAPKEPCEPSPCGINSECKPVNGRAVCSCLPGMLGIPPYCRPECFIHADCPTKLACLNNKCRNPCVGSCGFNAECSVVNHQPVCRCAAGFKGDPFNGCNPVPVPPITYLPTNPCVPSPCGPNALCKESNGAGSCVCSVGYFGDPYVGCRPECVQNSDCAWNLACVNNKCIDPCPGACGLYAECKVVHHASACFCLHGYTGNPLSSCRRIVHEPPTVHQHPCMRSPCGPYSECRAIDDRAVCSCLSGYFGSPPSCHPECVTSSDCPQDKSCVNHICSDPCPGICGYNARCQVINHNPICSCKLGYTGDPFSRCVEIINPLHEPEPHRNPCVPSPCGPNSHCQIHADSAICSCIPDYTGHPPNCRPECTINAECSGYLACHNLRCRDPCPGSCAANAECKVVNHIPVCSCSPGYTGDPFVICSPILAIEHTKPTAAPDPCNPSPCGANAICREKNGAGSCTCLPEYLGDPYTGCRPECVLNSECSYNKACVTNKCVNPCIGVCGINAECRVINHAPSCSCISTYIGDPLVACHPPPLKPPTSTSRPRNPCIPSPCGPYSECRAVDNHAVCSCQKNYIGSPPSCRPECMVSSECPQEKACLKQKCTDPCIGTCGQNARCQVVNHNPICSCAVGYTGDPFVRCIKEQPPSDPIDPCVPSPCGPNSQCQVVGNTPACSCIPNYIGRPPNCRPECTINEECAGNLACQNERCIDPCPGSCGLYATCQTIKHISQCTCIAGYTGDPFSGCIKIVLETPTEGPRDPCRPSPCGSNAICKEKNGAGSCTCLPEYFGDPYTGCRPECVTNSDCDRSKACLNNRCRDPCDGTCGVNAECRVINHAPSCSCIPGFVGDPVSACHPAPSIEPEKPRNPCIPSPCGPYSECRQIDNHAVCSCQSNYIGSPPSCRPECMISSECAQDKACIRQKCVDPCPGTCGNNARCQVVNHSPICSCPSGFSGDPFTTCLKEQRPQQPATPLHPCIPSPCGPYSECRVVGNTPACSCIQDYVGRPPNCRPECTINPECPGNLACVGDRCKDPCPGSCGAYATCLAVNHAPQCTCQHGFTGDPFAGCNAIPQIVPTEGPKNPCNPSPCGANAICKERNGAGSCSCLPEYFGDPYTGCRPECVTNSDCDRTKACMNNKCKDPCPGTCGVNAECRVVNHAPSCSCNVGFIGDPVTACHPIPQTQPEKPSNPCIPSPCGPYSECRPIDDHAVCSCQRNYVGSPPSCKPECVVSTECAQDKACIKQKCVDPCPGTCGFNARCQVVNHNPICSCLLGYTGDPFTQCILEPITTTEAAPSGNPCIPSPCGPNSECRIVGNTPACSCIQNYIGRPPNCRPECTINAECPGNLACNNERCRDPCPGSCGVHAICTTINHAPQCSCDNEFTGDPFAGCNIIVQTPTEKPRDPCNPSPCGANAICKEQNGAGSCSCMPEYFGDAYTGCRPECVANSDCDRNKACLNNRCKDPCPGTCGLHAECIVANHAPSCSCLPGYTGNPLSSCVILPSTERTPIDPCSPSPCGPNSVCREINGHAVCSCVTGFIGSPPSCRPECVVSSECVQDKACINQKCVDPCPNRCGLNARCQVVNHNPICSCSVGYTGDPFSSCKKIQTTTMSTPTQDPCVPSPCGPHSQCRVINNSPACSCLNNYIGQPPNCRPECVIHAECASNLACKNERCIDPCPGSCGQFAYCSVVNHNSVCSCPPGFTGNPLFACHREPTTQRTPVQTEPCFPSPCGTNAECINRNGAAACKCAEGFFGDPYSGCRRECESNLECGLPLACIGYKCVDPCPGTCGIESICTVVNHIPVCSCPPGYSGDPFFSCRPVPVTPTAMVPRDPCYPSPCGPNSQCRQINSQAVCTCLTNYQGSPPNCRPECVVSSECPSDRACINQRCLDPCPNTCGSHAQCTVKNHNPFCSCPPQFSGDPFFQCLPIPVTPLPPTEAPPSCVPSPCGPNSQCKMISGSPVCSCLPDYIGSPPSCRPECILSAECLSQLACINQHCRDPCPGSCGANANCHVLNHVPICTCNEGHTGDPFTLCNPIPIITPRPQDTNPCQPSPCGPNAICHGDGICECLPDYSGNPYESCRPQCVISADCPRDKACIRNKCHDPCEGTCGQNAKCDVINHIPVCSCSSDFVGDPFTLCRPKPQDLPPKDPCSPSPCGPNSQCRYTNGHAVCSCLSGYSGSPPSCRPECIVSGECSAVQACVNMKCVNPCVGVCGLGARCEVINHSPICSCREGQTGDPFRSCYDIPPIPVAPESPPSNPCVPSPCGPNSRCQTIGNQPSCSCLQGYVGAPPACRPECVSNSDCSSNQVCVNNKCRNPCPESCGINAQCQVISHTVSCICMSGYVGNPFEQCTPQQQEPTNPCEPSPCGANAVCKQQNGAGSCSCIPDYHGNPYEGCRPECVLSSDCLADRACIRNKCLDPCIGVCGTSSTCSVINHVPTCNCIPGYEGNPFSGCRPIAVPATQSSVLNPCSPSPCGPNSNCKVHNGQSVCSCQADYLGSPPDCRPECVVSSECPPNRACYKLKCTDPCPGTCGLSARCEVVNHHPICSCPSGFTGDPFSRCYMILPPPLAQPVEPVNPCVPSPCGPNSECQVNGKQASCRCRENFIGQPPNCRPECVVNTDCLPTLACISDRCRDPCIGSCGLNAECHIQNHIPICSCIPQYTGDPFTQCSQIIEQRPSAPIDPCNPSPCGANANCKNGLCTCVNNYFGDAYVGCRPECTTNAECTPNKACINQRCVNPCIGTCGQNAGCDVVNHIPTCTCPPQTAGDAFVACHPVVQEPPKDLCNPSPCGPNSICRVVDGHAVCSCQPGLIGSPPSCKQECIVSAECPLVQACLMNKCKDPCPGTCGLHARCQVVNHNPICSCPQGFTGDPFRHCHTIPAVPSKPADPTNPCVPSPCGPNAVCQQHNESPACSCLANYIGAPPNCRPECTINPECPSNLACNNQRCTDPCAGSCGSNAVCSVVNHIPVCSCTERYTGDPFSSCSPIVEPSPSPATPQDPCYPSPCGPNARCRIENTWAVCECISEYQGNPYEGCRPECIVSSDCPMNKACIRNKCKDPCPGTCGFSAICSTSNHIAVCYCPEGTTGDAFRSCQPIPAAPAERHPTNPCVPSPCGPNTRCQVLNNAAICECLASFQGSPATSGCRPECVISSDCPRNRACENNKCIDPCPGVCGYKAICQTINHSPICSCPAPTVGNPFSECKDIPEPPVDPCNPSPCRQNGQCRVVGTIASCTYPECVINQDCSRDKACYNQKCQDPCVGACGINAICQVANHDAVCSCPAGFYGQPSIQCIQQAPPQPVAECTSDSECLNDKACINTECKDPCSTTTCAQNSDCRVQQHRPFCFCKDSMTGDGYKYCYEIGCKADSDCLPQEACVNRQCIDPCAYTQCGENAVCRVDVNHKARCYCPDSYVGNALIKCERPQCLSHDDCPSYLVCNNQRCQDPCNCGENALCSVVSHVVNCRCPPGYTGNPHTSCVIAPITPTVECKMDADCPSKLACFSSVCKNPCVEAKPCGPNAECTVVDSLPLRTMTCQCLPGYVGDADVQCKLVADDIGCKSVTDCASTEVCVNRQCVSPCVVSNPCATNALCHTSNHKATCSCPAGLIGDPFTNCYKVPPALPECSTDSDCPNIRSCINERCQDPCAISNPCGTYADCLTVQHRPVCNCPDGWAGTPQVHCYKPECKADSDCVYDKSCLNGNCVSPCASMTCGVASQCIVQAHQAQCICPTGTQGNPLVSCVSVACQYNEDCPDDEACDRLNRKCRPVCEQDTCAELAICTAKDHQPSCACLPGKQGDPYVECTDSRIPGPSPECTKDPDCGPKHACINRKCENPCRSSSICSPDQECQVLDTIPVKTVMCVCPPDTIATNDGHCKPIVAVEPQCHVDNDCANTDRCVRGGCIEACKMDPCGLNSICKSYDHQAICNCPIGYIGNPYVECINAPTIPMPPSIPQCTRNDDCSNDLTCVNERCVNPCYLDNPCALGALCHVEGHKPICHCPIGYLGDATISCNPPVGSTTIACKTNDECTLTESCINQKCINPCSCGPNSECKVQDHYPICYCKQGYYGNPQLGCIKVACESDDECNSQHTCYNGECVNPCILQDVCGVNAQCYGLDHKATCKCAPGYIGNAYEACQHVECHIDVDCPNDKICSQQRCLNPCDDFNTNPCAHNAICYVNNHATGCACPQNLPIGNPLLKCDKPPSAVPNVECHIDADCPSKLACIGNRCLNPCVELQACSETAKCNVLDSSPVRTITCTCPEGWVPNTLGQCRPVIIGKPPGCIADSDCSSEEACINRLCRNPCDCGTNAECHVRDHRPVCSCKQGYEGNANVICKLLGCRRDSECESGKSCINGNCVNGCILNKECGLNAECYTRDNKQLCRCLSGYRGNAYDVCHLIECRSNSDCPDDRSCINAQCINPCTWQKPCAQANTQCTVKNHMALCRCAIGTTGNPYHSCVEERKTQCTQDSDCPSILACLNNKCENPCTALEPCEKPAECVVEKTLPVRTMICVCPTGYISSGSGTCKPIPEVKSVACTADEQCPSDKACVNGICIDPCDCAFHAQCFIKNHKPVCSCLPGYDGNPNLQCVKSGCKSNTDCPGQDICENRICVPACASDGSSCGTDALCYGVKNRAVCECPPGLIGNAQVACILVTCKADSDCPSDRACINKQCVDACSENKECEEPSVCVTYNHKVQCICPPGYRGNVKIGCEKVEKGCRSDSECPSQTACINELCVNPCKVAEPCGTNAVCKVTDTVPVRTMVCQCLPGYQGNAAVNCVEVAKCPIEKGFIRDEHDNCVCPPGMALNYNEECRRCVVELGYKVDESGHCVCALERGLIINERGQCICPLEHGYILDIHGNCVPVPKTPGCDTDDDCADDKYCETTKRVCLNPCDIKECGVNAKCNATHHIAICVCPYNFYGNADVECKEIGRKEFPKAELMVTCLSDGIQVRIELGDSDFNGVLYVKGHSKEEECRRVITSPSVSRIELFKVLFGDCGLIHVNGQASFVLVIQKHPKLVTYRAQAYHIKCVYQTSEQNVTIGFNVSMLTTAGTIANTGPPPTCLMKIITQTGQEINSAEIGENLMLQVDVHPSSIYGGFARSCVAKTTDNNVENEYIVTDENGCATDPTVFGEWQYNADTQSLIADFNAFKFPSSDNIRFQCNIRVCFGKCQPVNCAGYNAYGKRRRRRDIDSSNNTDIDVLHQGQLREEITIESNAIFTFERKEERLVNPTEQPQIAGKMDDICISLIWLILSLVITALLALVAVAVATSCWLLAYRRQPSMSGPLPHPPEFPNPIFSSPEITNEPSPDYLS